MLLVRMTILSCAMGIFSTAALAAKPEKPPTFCPAISVRGLGAEAASSLSVNDFRVYENSSFWGGRNIPGIVCSKADKDKLNVRGGIFYSDAMTSCKFSQEELKRMSDEILKYNRTVASSSAFQSATGCHAE